MTTYKARDVYAAAREQIDRELPITAGEDRDRAVCRILASTIPTYTWVGIYRLRGRRLALSAAHGPDVSAPASLARGQSAAGRAAAERRPVEIPVLQDDQDAIAWFPDARAELAVPVTDGERTLAVIDVQSNQRNPFGIADLELLHEIASRLAVRSTAS